MRRTLEKVPLQAAIAHVLVDQQPLVTLRCVANQSHKVVMM